MKGRGGLYVAATLLAAAAISRAGVDPVGGTGPRMDFVPPTAGSYQLQRIQASPDGVLLDAKARATRLSKHTTGKISLLTFFYTYCADPWGCPFAY